MSSKIPNLVTPDCKRKHVNEEQILTQTEISWDLGEEGKPMINYICLDQKNSKNYLTL